MTTGTQPDHAATFQLKAIMLHQDDNNSVSDANVIDASKAFRVYLEFSGTGITWNGFVKTSQPVTINYYAEGKGGVPDLTLGAKNLNLGVLGGDPTATVPASATEMMAMIKDPGLYELAATVTFDNFPGYAGFVDGLIIEVI